MKENIIFALLKRGVDLVKNKYVGLFVRHALTAISGWFGAAWISVSSKLSDVAESADLEAATVAATQVTESLQSDQFTNGAIAFLTAVVGIIWSIIEKKFKKGPVVDD